MKSNAQKIFFIDNDISSRKLLYEILNGAGYEVVCFANTSLCLGEIEKNSCNLLIMDFKIPDMDGMRFLSKIRKTFPWIPILVSSDLKDISMAVKAIKYGASDFIEKPFDKTNLLTKVKEILSVSEFDSFSTPFKLTKTEKKMLKLILDGYNHKEIAFKTGCAIRTVEFHQTNIYRKFGVNNPVELTKKALEMFPSKPL